MRRGQDENEKKSSNGSSKKSSNRVGFSFENGGEFNILLFGLPTERTKEIGKIQTN